MAKGKRYLLYVGANNRTNVLEDEKLRKIANKYLKGYTLDYGKGLWEGREEDSVVIDIINPESQKDVDKMAQEIANKLNQDVVLRTWHGVDVKFIAKRKLKEAV